MRQYTLVLMILMVQTLVLSDFWNVQINIGHHDFSIYYLFIIVKPGERVWNGSLGGFVDTKYGLGFLTCAHVLYDEVRLHGNLPNDSDYVVQPAGDNTDHECGKVEKTVFDTTGPVGVDAALVRVTKQNRFPQQGWFTGLSQDNMEFAGIVEEFVYVDLTSQYIIKFQYCLFHSVSIELHPLYRMYM